MNNFGITVVLSIALILAACDSGGSSDHGNSKSLSPESSLSSSSTTSSSSSSATSASSSSSSSSSSSGAPAASTGSSSSGLFWEETGSYCADRGAITFCRVNSSSSGWPPSGIPMGTGVVYAKLNLESGIDQLGFDDEADEHASVSYAGARSLALDNKQLIMFVNAKVPGTLTMNFFVLNQSSVSRQVELSAWRYDAGGTRCVCGPSQCESWCESPRVYTTYSQLIEVPPGGWTEYSFTDLNVSLVDRLYDYFSIKALTSVDAELYIDELSLSIEGL